MKKVLGAAVTAAAAILPVVRLSPPSAKVAGARTVAELVARLQATGLEDRALVDAAIAAVAGEYTHYSAWHLWETPEQSLALGRGWSHQYNTVLLEVLRGLGFSAGLVHAARVRGWRHPWWHTGHTWVKVDLDGRRRDACASLATNRVDAVGFVPVTTELPYRDVTRVGIALALAPFVVFEVWRAWLTGRPVSTWVYRPR